jgi:hypothetical protein
MLVKSLLMEVELGLKVPAAESRLSFPLWHRPLISPGSG